MSMHGSTVNKIEVVLKANVFDFTKLSQNYRGMVASAANSFSSIS